MFININTPEFLFQKVEVKLNLTLKGQIKVKIFMNELVQQSYTDDATGKILSFNEEGMLVDTEGNGPPNEIHKNGSFVNWLHSYVQQRLIEEGLIIDYVGDDVPIYRTPGALNSAKKLLILVSGSGRIMAGLWSVGVCTHRGLRAGSVLPCIEEARKRDMEVIILNPNHPKAAKRYKHSEIVFDEVIIPSNF